MEGRVRWFAEVIGAGLDKGLISPKDILDHATPNVLAENVPRDTIAALLRASLAAPKMSPASVIETVTPAVLAKHVPHPTLWGCVSQCADRGGLGKDGDDALKKDEDKKREFLRTALQSGMDAGVLEAKDVVRHVNASVIGYHFPNEITAKLLEASLSTGKMTPDTVIGAVGPDVMAKHAPAHVLWACVADVAQRALNGAAKADVPERLPSAPPVGDRRMATTPEPVPPPLADAPVAGEGAAADASDDAIEIDESEVVEETDPDAKSGAKKRIGLFSRRKRV